MIFFALKISRGRVCCLPAALLFILGTTVITSIVFWTSNLLFISLDLFGFPSSLLKYKVQEEKKVPYVCSNMSTVNVLNFQRLFPSVLKYNTGY